MSDVTNGKGGANIDVSAPAQFNLVTRDDGDYHKTAMTLKVWNTGDGTLFATVNEELATFTQDTAVPIPSGESFWFVGQPMRRLILSSSDGTTANYGAY